MAPTCGLGLRCLTSIYTGSATGTLPRMKPPGSGASATRSMTLMACGLRFAVEVVARTGF